MQTVSKQKLSDLAKKRGIYAVLLVGVFVVVAVVMVMLTNNAGKSNEENQIDLNEPPINSAQQNLNDNNSTYANDNMQTPDSGEQTVVPDQIAGTEPVEPDVDTTPVAETTPEPTEKPDVADTTETTEKQGTEQVEKETTKPVMQTTAENLTFNKEEGLDWPVKGNIILPYCVDKTTYYATLKQYMTNPAILIASEIGTEVKSSAKGIVTNITNDVRTGNTLTMDIGSGYKLVYGQLDSSLNHKVGDVIEAGETIGKISRVTKYFVVEGSHLYFQVFEGEETVDPMSLLKAE